MRITLARGGQKYGPFTVDQVNSMLIAGKAAPTDLAWVEGTPDWVALMGLESSEQLAVHVYRLSIKKGREVYEYADIVEVHHPDYMTARDLAALYPLRAGDRASNSSRSAALALLATAD